MSCLFCLLELCGCTNGDDENDDDGDIGGVIGGLVGGDTLACANMMTLKNTILSKLHSFFNNQLTTVLCGKS